MPKGEPLSRYQQKIVNRYYEHLDTATLHKLGELVSDLYVSAGDPKADKLWKSVERALSKTTAHADRAKKIIAGKDVTALAALVGELTKSQGQAKH